MKIIWLCAPLRSSTKEGVPRKNHRVSWKNRGHRLDFKAIYSNLFLVQSSISKVLDNSDFSDFQYMVFSLSLLYGHQSLSLINSLLSILGTLQKAQVSPRVPYRYHFPAFVFQSVCQSPVQRQYLPYYLLFKNVKNTK